MDSLLHPSEDLKSAYAINNRENYIRSNEADTTGHGEDVLELLGYFAPRAEFNLYRVIAADGTAKRGNLVDAIGDASAHGVDLLNLSIGVFHGEEEDHDCGGMCRVADETRLAIEDGVTVLTATGNRKRDDPLAVHCPALTDEAIGVGGFVSRCRTDLIETEQSGQYWVRNDEVRGPFCGQRGCSPDQACEDNRYEYPWRGNVSFHNAEPDVLAPVHHPSGSIEEPVLKAGTSFGVPVVSGLLAVILGDLIELGIDPAPENVHRAVVEGGVDIDEGGVQKFHADNTWEFLEAG